MDFIYQSLAKIGYTHPLHPALTHLPVGLVIGAFLFALAAGGSRRRSALSQAARYCMVLALIALFPTALLGYMDWQHFYAGSLLFPIKMKLILAGVLLILLIIAAGFGSASRTIPKTVISIYLLCVLTVVGLGYFGGQLVFGPRPAAAGAPRGLAAEGAAVFQKNCSACHFTASTAKKVGPGLKSIFKLEKFPVSGWTVSDKNLRRLLKTPVGTMPPFGHLSEKQVAALAAYLKTL